MSASPEPPSYRDGAPGPAPPRISIRGLDFHYGRQRALEAIDLAIPDRRVTAFIGPSGCGKSTLLRCLNRLHDLYPRQRAAGSILLDGAEILGPGVDLQLLRRRVGMVFQSPTPFPMSIYDNVAFGVRLYEALGRRQLDARVAWALGKAALWDEVRDRLDERAANLSGGQQQRLSIARAVALRPEVLLLDEPTSALDPIATAAVEELLRELARDYTLVLVTHNLHQARRVADRTAFLYLGRLIEEGPTARLFDHPENERTADYLGGRFG